MLKNKRFQKTVEDFTCEHCDHEVKGNGFTNHCPHCLWSKHVDENPGDRAATCGGMMEPVRVEVKKTSCVITHRCEACNFERRQRSSVNDDFDQIIELSLLLSHGK